MEHRSSSANKTPTMDDTVLPFPVTESSPRNLHRRSRLVYLLSSVLSTIRTNLSAGTPPSSSTSYDDRLDTRPQHNLDLPEPGTVVTSEEEDGFISKVVVEQSWGSGTRSKQPTSDSSDPASHDHKDSKSGETQPVQIMNQSDEREVDVEGKHNLFLVILLRILLTIKHFFYPRPFDVGSEKRYDEDDWYSKKLLAQLASIWLVINLALGCVSVPRPWTIMDYIFYSGVAPAFTLPIFVMIMYNWPRDRRVLYQSFVVFALWMWPFNLVLNMRLCGFYDSSIAVISCNGKDFINVLFYATAMQAIGLFGLRLDRLPAALAAAAWFIIACALIIPDHTVWWRSVINFAVFHIFLIWVHERRESSERRLYAMKVQVKNQYKALQRAQEAERRTSESKHRLTSYVFHEVRVPLNSALLAAQSMESSGTVSKALDVEFDALMGSLTMMSQVLNDVLDFNRLDSGQFELVSKPYAFHQTIRSLFIPLQMATAQKGLTLHTELDPNIDKVARRAAYRAMGEREDVIQRHLKQHPDVDGVVIGDEARFRQIITNFASNACKFTPEGGSVTVKTKLVTPIMNGPSTSEAQKSDPDTHDELSALRLAQHDYDHANDDNGSVVVRVEVTDTGCGIEESELAGSKLFSAFNQTERGKQQGGKGTGLGLALVRNIVKLSGGRLGVKSQFNKGSTFWVELPLGVGRKALIPSPGINMFESQGSDSSMGSDVAKVRAAAVQRESLDGIERGKECLPGDPCPVHVQLTTKNTLANVVDAAALKASEMSSVMRSSNLMHSTIMEQNGRVDLVVDSQTPSVPLASIRASPSIMSGTPTPNTTDLSFSFHSHRSKGSKETPQSEKSQNLSIGSGVDIGNGAGASPGDETTGAGEEEEESRSFPFSSNSDATTAQPPSLASFNSEATTGPPQLSMVDYKSPLINAENDFASTSTVPTHPVQRPTHIPMPATPQFEFAQSERSPSTSVHSPQSNEPAPITSPLTLFDNSFSRSTGYDANIHDFGVTSVSVSKKSPHHAKNNSQSDFSPGLTVLVVDDDAITRMMMERLLRRHGCEVTTADNGRVALELILGDEFDPDMLEFEAPVGSGAGNRKSGSRADSRTGSRSQSRSISLSESNVPSSRASVPDQNPGVIAGTISQVSDQTQSMMPQKLSRFAVVFLDNSMPVLSGLKTVEILRRLRRRDFVVGLTGNALLTDQDEYSQAGVDIVLTKPVMQNKLVYILKEADARRQHQLSLLQKNP